VVKTNVKNKQIFRERESSERKWAKEMILKCGRTSLEQRESCFGLAT
jgi:hypothetical protein